MMKMITLRLNQSPINGLGITQLLLYMKHEMFRSCIHHSFKYVEQEERVRQILLVLLGALSKLYGGFFPPRGTPPPLTEIFA